MEIILRDADVPDAHTIPTDWGDEVPSPFRETVRAVAYDPQRKEFLLLHVAKYDRYEVAGGGMEAGENPEETLARELREEAGVTDFEIITELTTIREYLERAWLERLHHAFLVVPVGTLSSPEFTEKEIREVTSLRWMPMHEALDIMQTARGRDYGSRFAWNRSRLLVAEALEYLQQHPL